MGRGGPRKGAGMKSNPISKHAVANLKRELLRMRKETGRPWENSLAELAYLPTGSPEELERNGFLKMTALKLIAELVVEGRGEVSIRINM